MKKVLKIVLIAVGGIVTFFVISILWSNHKHNKAKAEWESTIKSCENAIQAKNIELADSLFDVVSETNFYSEGKEVALEKKLVRGKFISQVDEFKKCIEEEKDVFRGGELSKKLLNESILNPMLSKKEKDYFEKVNYEFFSLEESLKK